MENDEHIEDLLYAYFARELTPGQEEELLDWLNADPSHKERLSQAADLWATAHVPLFMQNRQSDLEHFFEIQSQQKHPGRISRMLNRVFIRNIAAAILALVAMGYASYYIGQEKGKGEIAAILENQEISSEVITPMGATTQIQLPDGSTAIVNAGTRLTYRYNYKEAIREITLDGEAFFDVTPNPECPFVVKSNDLDIKVLGTTFNVKSYADDPAIKIALVTGAVKVKINEDDLDRTDFTLSPDRMLTFNKESHQVEIAGFRAKDALAWTTGSLKFENLSFAQIAKDLERKFNVQINIESKRLRDEIFSGTFSADYSLSQILREVDVENRYRWTRQKDRIIIHDKY